MLKQLFSRIFEPVVNGTEVIYHLAKLLNVNITLTSINDSLQQHPNFPSLLSVSDNLSFFGIENMTIKVPAEKTGQIPVPFIAQIKATDNANLDLFTVVRRIDDNSATFFNPENQKWNTCSTPKFNERFSGIALIAEAGSASGEKNYLSSLRAENQKKNLQVFMALVIPLAVLMTTGRLLMNNGANIYFHAAFLLLSMCGALLCMFLLLFEIGQFNPVFRKICGTDEKRNCSSILQSKGSKIFGIHLSIIGFSFFSGELLLLLLTGLRSDYYLKYMALTTIAASPFICYSLFYQWKIALQWCILCLLVQLILAIQLTIVLSGGWLKGPIFDSFTYEYVLALIIAFSIPFIASYLLLSFALKIKEQKRAGLELNRLKHDPVIFEALLEKQRQLQENSAGLGILLGNPNAKHKIIKVCNPYCPPCAKAHKPIEELLANNPDLHVQIIFTATNQENDRLTPPVKHLMAIAETKEESIVKDALESWYMAPKKDYEAFSKRFPLNGELTQQSEKIEAMSAFCSRAKIAYTPTFFISLANPNNESDSTFHELPGIFSVHDLKYFFST